MESNRSPNCTIYVTVRGTDYVTWKPLTKEEQKEAYNLIVAIKKHSPDLHPAVKKVLAESTGLEAMRLHMVETLVEGISFLEESEWKRVPASGLLMKGLKKLGGKPVRSKELLNKFRRGLRMSRGY